MLNGNLKKVYYELKALLPNDKERYLFLGNQYDTTEYDNLFDDFEKFFKERPEIAEYPVVSCGIHYPKNKFLNTTVLAYIYINI